MSDAIPTDTILPIVCPSGFIDSLFILKFLALKKYIILIKNVTICPITVANAAPLTPISSPKINTGS